MEKINLRLPIKKLLLCFILAGSIPGYGQDTKTYRVLFLGNSVFYYHGGLYQPFMGFCKEAGLNYQAVSQRNTPQYPNGIEFLDYGRIPLNLPEIAADSNIHRLIRSGNFDYVIVEGRRSGFLLPEGVKLTVDRGQPIPYEKNLEAISSIHQTIVRSGAKTVLYMHPGLHANEDSRLPIAQVYQKLHSDLEKMSINGEQHQVILVPALYLWMNAMNRYKIEGWYADMTHGNALARYASACMIYTYITGKDPRKNAFNKLTEHTWEIADQANAYVKPDDEKWIKDQVWLYYTTRP
ncbi:MAG: hypothetical protein ACFHWX_22305 [Bacteroidota bacterium]